MYFDMVPSSTISKKGVKEVRVCSSGIEKRRLTVALCCTGSGKMLPSLAVFKGKEKTEVQTPERHQYCCSKKGVDGRGSYVAMVQSNNSSIYSRRKSSSTVCVDSFSGHEIEEFMEAAKENNVDVVIIPGGCTSKVQPLDVCLNKPFKSILKIKWLKHIESQVVANPSLDKLATASKETCSKWVKAGHDYLNEHEEMVKKSSWYVD